MVEPFSTRFLVCSQIISGNPWFTFEYEVFSESGQDKCLLIMSHAFYIFIFL